MGIKAAWFIGAAIAVVFLISACNKDDCPEIELETRYYKQKDSTKRYYAFKNFKKLVFWKIEGLDTQTLEFYAKSNIDSISETYDYYFGPENQLCPERLNRIEMRYDSYYNESIDWLFLIEQSGYSFNNDIKIRIQGPSLYDTTKHVFHFFTVVPLYNLERAKRLGYDKKVNIRYLSDSMINGILYQDIYKFNSIGEEPVLYSPNGYFEFTQSLSSNNYKFQLAEALE